MKLFSLKRKVTKFFKKIKEQVTSFGHRLFVRPFIAYLEKRQKEQKLKQLIKEFEKRFKTDIEDVKAIMRKQKHYEADSNERQKYLNQKLVEGRENILKFHKYISGTPCFYDPDVVQIHNENLNRNAPDIATISSKEYKRAKNILEDQGPAIKVVPKINTSYDAARRTITISDMGHFDLPDAKRLEQKEIKDMDDFATRLRTMLADGAKKKPLK